MEHLFALSLRGGVVQVHDHVFCALDSFKGLADDMLARLGEHLNADIVGYQPVRDKTAAEFVFRFACRGETYLDLLKAELYEHPEEFELFIEAHRYHKSLIPVAEINAAPYRSFIDVLFFHPLIAALRRHEIISLIFAVYFHFTSPATIYIPAIFMTGNIFGSVHSSRIRSVRIFRRCFYASDESVPAPVSVCAVSSPAGSVRRLSSPLSG